MIDINSLRSGTELTWQETWILFINHSLSMMMANMSRDGREELVENVNKVAKYYDEQEPTREEMH